MRVTQAELAQIVAQASNISERLSNGLFEVDAAQVNQLEFRAGILATYGASAYEIKELLTYNQNVFDHSSLTLPLQFPLSPEPHVAAWEKYVADAREMGVFQALQQRLVQLQFPIQEGISQTEAYRAATRKGTPVDDRLEATSLRLNYPEKLQLVIHQSLAGAIPVLIAGNREDFVSLVQALTMHNEPKSVPNSMGACMVAGFNNWDRIRQYKKQWETAQGAVGYWEAEFKQLIVQKHLYQDRFIILSDGAYSNVSAQSMGLSEEEWCSLSLKIRLEHECTHYFTRRLFGSMHNNLIDELIADAQGIVAAAGNYRAEWFLGFLGLESFPDYREGGRLQNYRGQPPLSDGAFKILQALVKDAAENLELFDSQHRSELSGVENQALFLITLTYLTLEELASLSANSLLETTWNRVRTKCNRPLA
jgi:hypothetical protein